MGSAGATRANESATLLERIASARDTLTPTARRIGDVVSEDAALVARIGIEELAERAGTSTASVNRFCRMLGLAGYTELRLALAGEAGRGGPADVHDPDADPSGDLPADADADATVALLASSTVHAIRRTAQLLDTADLDRLAGAVAEAGQVQVFAFGGSADVAHYLAAQLTGIGVPTLTSADVHTAAAYAVTLGPDDVAIAISHSGRAVQAIELLDLARSRGATTAAVTSSAASPLAMGADVTLATTARTATYRYRGTAGRHAQLFVTDALYVRVAQRRAETARQLLDLAGAATARYQVGPARKRAPKPARKSKPAAKSEPARKSERTRSSSRTSNPHR
ncbi:DNA-binding transcriptional regulator, MurR/RpiR family, contains HTH and SIS domains [Actinopolymorpha cephalotaxi]|uniref:DNA-binding MurR/RpiR family transcriptional regulator n=1 Tax=Actinopolymorpha cephalotaxi TaxID=504797 RepID=A0A1I2PII3_9ACTN|nr:MurR/RpiR family transcriptional regulator [Actinopolymorpha cephalotaxi]NYH83611.1 DNA-binding MurR/RpiR family transcriptional regulator [Actinopolymorpha cephalotaxi]SFG15370.1 DNA-binding transcriptional regulator, MurR/RpiR family, contains HTH and SIS domains [Actinopolymorpha cephalotaxi]